MNNRLRIFADVVSIDAWHKPFGENCPRADLHVDAVFREAVAMGGEEASRVRFRLSLKRAEVVVVIPPAEPVIIDRSSVARETPILEGKQTTSIVKKKQAAANAKIAFKVGGSSGATAECGVCGEQSHAHGETTEISRDVKLMIVMHSNTREGCPRWEFTPARAQVARAEIKRVLTSDRY
jgi:hypothetical protein